MPESLLPQASTTLKGVQKFLGVGVFGGLEKRVENNEKKITSLKNIIKLRKVNVDKLLPASSDGKDKDQTIVTNNLADRLDNIAQTLGVLTRALKQQFKLDKKESDQSRRDRQRQEKKDREGFLETPRKIVGGIANTLTKPFRGLFDTIVNFFKNILFGAAILKFIEWLRNPENQAKIEAFKKFLTEELPDIINGVVDNVKKNWPWYIAGLVAIPVLIGEAIKGIFGAVWRFLKWLNPFKKKPPKDGDDGDDKGGGGTGVTSPEIITDPTVVGDSPGVVDVPVPPAVEPEKKPNQIGDWFKKRQEQLGNLMGQATQAMAELKPSWLTVENVGKVGLAAAILAIGWKLIAVFGVVKFLAGSIAALFVGLQGMQPGFAAETTTNFSSTAPGDVTHPSQSLAAANFAPKLVASRNISPPLTNNGTRIINLGDAEGGSVASNSTQGGTPPPSFSSTSGNNSLVAESVFSLANA